MTQSGQTVRHRTFEYSTSTRWVRDRVGTIGAQGRPTLDVASPPEFKGIPGVWTPEDLFVAAIDLCQMETFLGILSRTQNVLVSYTSSARGTLEFQNGGYRFTKVLLKPTIVVKRGSDLTQIGKIVQDAHNSCLIGRSVNAEIEVTPEIFEE